VYRKGKDLLAIHDGAHAVTALETAYKVIPVLFAEFTQIPGTHFGGRRELKLVSSRPLEVVVSINPILDHERGGREDLRVCVVKFYTRCCQRASIDRCSREYFVFAVLLVQVMNYV
jgi:hypothetical protein